MAPQRSVEELERLIQEAVQRAEYYERQRAEIGRQRIESAQQRIKSAEERIKRAEEQSRPTTLDEYITACHASLFSRFTINANLKLLTSNGPIPKPREKWCPQRLRPWPDFLDQQRRVFGKLYTTFPPKTRVFENRCFLTGMGNRISNQPIVNEKSLGYFLNASVEFPVSIIFKQLKEVHDVREAFQIGDGIISKNNPHALSDISEEVVERETPATPQAADQICIYRSENALSKRRTMVYVYEYKSPHKLTAVHLRLGLRPMDVFRDVVNRKTIPTSVDPEARVQYQADRLTASAVTQTYHYMIESGLEYSLLTTECTLCT
ncbi:hypothetical protein ACHAPT_008350 [Fusarium lateritium]